MFLGRNFSPLPIPMGILILVFLAPLIFLAPLRWVSAVEHNLSRLHGQPHLLGFGEHRRPIQSLTDGPYPYYIPGKLFLSSAMEKKGSYIPGNILKNFAMKSSPYVAGRIFQKLATVTDSPGCPPHRDEEEETVVLRRDNRKQRTPTSSGYDNRKKRNRREYSDADDEEE